MTLIPHTYPTLPTSLAVSSSRKREPSEDAISGISKKMLTSIPSSPVSLTITSVQALHKARMPRGLARVCISNVNISLREATKIGSLIFYSNARELSIKSSLFDTGALFEILRKRPPNMTHLNLKNNEIEPDDLNKISELAPLFITHLDISENPIGAEGALIIAEKLKLPSLLKLDISCCNIGDDGLKYLASSFQLNSLTHLNARDNEIGDKAVFYFSQSPHLKSLRFLDISKNEIFEDAKEAFSDERWASFRLVTE
jgi:hypothetical protein